MSVVSFDCKFECGEIVYHKADKERALQLFIVQRQVHDFNSAISVSYMCRLCALGGKHSFVTNNPWRHEYWEEELTR